MVSFVLFYHFFVKILMKHSKLTVKKRKETHGSNGKGNVT